MDAYPRLYYLIQDSKQYKFAIWGNDAKAKKLFRVLKLLDINPLYCVSPDPLITIQPDEEIPVRSVYDLAYEDLSKVKVLVFDKSARILKQLSEIGLDIRRNVQDILMYREPKFLDVDFPLDVIMGYIRPTLYNGTMGLNIYGNDSADIKIVTLGGSTTDDLTYDIRSWSEYLYEEAKAAGKSVCVLCGGVSGYNIYQEFNFLTRDILSLNPDIVIDYSGANQCGVIVEDKYPNINWYQRTLFDTIKIAAKDVDFHIGELKSNVNYGSECKTTLYENYKRILKIMNDVCAGQGISFVSYFQPLLADKIPDYLNNRERELVLHFAPPDKKQTRTETRRYRFVQEYYKDEEKLPFQSDLTKIFHYEDVYLDYAHVNDRGNELIAKHIWQDLIKRGYI